MRRNARVVAGLTALVAASGWASDPVLQETIRPEFAGTSGRRGILSVPSAETLSLGETQASIELSAGLFRRGPVSWSPTPLHLSVGAGRRVDLGLVLREGGRPGDPSPSPLMLGGWFKWGMFAPKGYLPGLALSVSIDRINAGPDVAAMAVASTARKHRVQLAAYLGTAVKTTGTDAVATVAGAGASLEVFPTAEAVGEWVLAPRGQMFSVGARWAVANRVGLSATGTWIPREGAFRVSVGIGVVADVGALTGRRSVEPVAEAPPPPPAPVKKRRRIPTMRMPAELLERYPSCEAPPPSAEPLEVLPAEQAEPTPVASAVVPDGDPQGPQSEELDHSQPTAQGLDGVAGAPAGRPRRVWPTAALPKKEVVNGQYRSQAEELVPARPLRLGSRGQQVDQLQQLLVDLEVAAPTDLAREAGSYGEATEAAVRRYQRERRLLANGTTGPKTLAALREEVTRSLALGPPARDPAAEPAPDTDRRSSRDLPATSTPTAPLRRGEDERRSLSAPQTNPVPSAVSPASGGTVAETRPGPSEPPSPSMRSFAEELVETTPRTASRSDFDTSAAAASASSRPSEHTTASRNGARTEVATATGSSAPSEQPVAARATSSDSTVPDQVGGKRRRAPSPEASEDQPPPPEDEAGDEGLAEAETTTKAPPPAPAPSGRSPPATPPPPASAATAPPPEPAPTRALAGAAGQRQLKEAIDSKADDIRRCARRQLKRRPIEGTLRGTLELSIDTKGRISQVGISSGALKGSEFEKCVREAAKDWRLPAGDDLYDVELPVEVVGKSP